MGVAGAAVGVTAGCAGGFCAGSCAHACGSGPTAIVIASKAASKGRAHCLESLAVSPNIGRFGVLADKSHFALAFNSVIAFLTLRI
jgi:hypothetical protein